jgi:anti-sigma factor RsiW
MEAYYEGVLSPREAELVTAHLRECARCAHELAQIGKIGSALSALPESEPSADLVYQISAKVAALPAPMGGRRLVAGWRRVEVIAVASIALLALWRYALPLLLSKEAAGAPAVRWFSHALVSVVARMDAFSVALHNLWIALQGTTDALGVAAAKAAPVFGMYAVAELVMIAAVVLVSQLAHRPRPASLTMLA